MTQFDDIRPYNDEEVAPAIDRLLADPELIDAVTRLRFPRLAGWMPWLLKPLVKRVLTRQLHGVSSVDHLQQIVSHYLDSMIERCVDQLTVSGLDKLDPNTPYLFISNHRDIAMDPAFVNWALNKNGFNTVRIAIGDNLLTKPYVSDLMRLNKSFIVKRSATSAREKFKASKHLSAYIHHSILEEKSNIWIAQREGRAKDGLDATNTAIISMLALSRPKTTPFAEFIRESNIVPVSISYEWDPCDAAKAKELHAHAEHGSYEKEEHEDVASIAMGIAGQKGSVHVAFGDVLKGNFENAEEVAQEIDRQVWDSYVLHPSNHLAYVLLNGEAADLPVSASGEPFVENEYDAEKLELKRRLADVPDEQKEIFLGIYANPVVSHLRD
ncbi:1-acyl-sn-glycerol-3-phosphate acyltransferase [Aestuariicella sp. G3-2]|uniref:1-acyl-sn-glycerol-3-phosphate acyltransferase n=1 Tax=Pseudomaricurvus albidus TaxID=2842452 RepID=UPI001C0E4810|nr:1-acyl-sn-glycerol-3-phosphate acyltransferase [Aestuariicella albida]MBU3069610.1 1-acyl-sn-glycerol-3-phosphate acyltransferase [Aestuariicella albida]